ncbi:hypothetical protein BC834DRAFT_134635 [Gloeopeniophorella convolvens]|nr:hypothetical protein BC834DRAFT_134635 [Gloeopeniophorella convolvens]
MTVTDPASHHQLTAYLCLLLAFPLYCTPVCFQSFTISFSNPPGSPAATPGCTFLHSWTALFCAFPSVCAFRYR